jgi:hypothetical protein
VFTCNFGGDPEPTVTWSKDGMTIKDEGRFMIVIKKGYTELEIEKVQYADAGTYQIALANPNGNAWAEAILDMNGKSLGSFIEEIKHFSQILVNQLQNYYL